MNWKNVIADLEESGLKQEEIAEKVGCSQSHISDLKTGRRGKRMGFQLGEALKSLWSETRASSATSNKQGVSVSGGALKADKDVLPKTA